MLFRSGCLLLVPFLELFGGPNTLIAAGVLYAISGAIWFNQAGAFRRRAMAVLVSLLLVGLMAANGKRGRVLDIHVAKGMALPEEAFVAWNGISRIGVSQSNGNWSIVIDADAATGIASFDWDHLTDADQIGRAHV